MTFLKTTALCCALLAGIPAFGQTNINLGAINADPTAPVEITADSLSIDQDSGTAVFIGNVVAGQGDVRLTSQRMLVNYNDQSGDISSLSATGGVTFVTDTEAAESETADYDLDAGTLVMSGDVLLTQGSSVIAADLMTVDLDTGAAQMQGRVRTIFTQGDN